MAKRKENNIPVIEFDKVDTIWHRYYRGSKYWEIYKLLDYVKDQKYPIFEIPLAGLNLNTMGFDVGCLDDFAWHMKRVQDTDLKHPIILDDLGQICDGNHRVIKALVKGDKTIKAIRILSMPIPDGHNESE